jgi:SAM-dependent methyltransferase
MPRDGDYKSRYSANHAWLYYTIGVIMQCRRRRQIKNAFIRSHLPFKGPLARGYLRGCERYLSLRQGRDRRVEHGGIAVPPARLRVLVAGTADLHRFLVSGQAHANCLREMLADADRPLDEMDAILDFGCGCGRMTRWLSDLSRPQIHACDYNRELVDWCDANLGFARACTTDLNPPLPYADGSFDILYAYSVLTHLSTELASQWLMEFKRLVKPGGLVWFTVHGEAYRDRLPPEQKSQFDAGEVVVWLPEVEGTNLCGSYWSKPSVRNMLGDKFEVLAHLDPRGDLAAAQHARLTHDAYLVQRA